MRRGASNKRITEGLLAISFLAISVCAAHAVTLTGSALTSIVGYTFPGYGTATSNNNVVNNGSVPVTGSKVTDPSSSNFGSLYIGGNGSAVTTSYSLYSVDWWYIGSESGDVNQFTAPGVAASNEDNRNNNNGYGVNPSPILYMGQSTNQTTTNVAFTITDLNAGTSVTNGPVNNNKAPTNGNLGASLVFAYLTGDAIAGWTLTNVATDWFLFGFNDSGNDDNHDDFMGVGHVSAVPLPAALPLFGGGLGLLAYLGRRRRKPMEPVAA